MGRGSSRVKPGATPRRAALAVTGACGFVGANVVLALARQGHRVVACDVAAPPEALRQAWARQPGHVRWLPLDVTTEGGWAFLDDEPIETIIHGAAITPGPSDETPAQTARVNLWGTVAALEYARRRGCRRFVFVSSSGVYGAVHSAKPLRETRPLRSASSYALTKLCGEQFVSLYRQSYGLDACSVRVAAAYGPWERPTAARTRMSLIHQLAAAALRRQRLLVSGTRVARDWTYVGDVAAGLAHLAVLPTLPFDLFNLSSGRATSLGAIVRTIRRLVPRAAIEVEDTRPSRADLVMGPSEHRAPLDVSRLRSTGFQARTSLASGLRMYLDWLKRSGPGDSV